MLFGGNCTVMLTHSRCCCQPVAAAAIGSCPTAAVAVGTYTLPFGSPDDFPACWVTSADSAAWLTWRDLRVSRLDAGNLFCPSAPSRSDKRLLVSAINFEVHPGSTASTLESPSIVPKTSKQAQIKCVFCGQDCTDRANAATAHCRQTD